MMENKIFNDLVHGYMSFHPLLVFIIDTPQMQRLRNIKQLGACYFVYPSASHNRFEHCLGTAHIAGKLFEKLKEGLKFSDSFGEKEWKKQKLCVQIAGLCHDAGHGPFSHTWEKFRRKLSDKDDWTHEIESTRVLDEILKESIREVKGIDGQILKTVKDVFQFYDLNSQDIKIIKDMILGRKNSEHYIYQIVNNKTNDIDVDKWDYLSRDSIMLNVKIGFDYERLLNYCFLKRNETEIVFREKECSHLIEMFLARGKLHDKAYQNIKVIIIEEMITDALVLANERLKLRETPVSQLTDHIYQRILYEDFGEDEDMRKAKEILRRIEKRDLYKCIAKESFEGTNIDAEKIKRGLKEIPKLKSYIDEISVTTIQVDMTSSNEGKTLKNVVVFPKMAEQDISAKEFNFEEYNDSLKINLVNLKRRQVLVLYKGQNEFPKDLKEDVKSCVRTVQQSNSTVTDSVQ